MARLCVCENDKIVFTLSGNKTTINKNKATAILNAIKPMLSYDIKEIKEAIMFWTEHIEHMTEVDEKKELMTEKLHYEEKGIEKFPTEKENRLEELNKIHHGRPTIYDAIATAMLSYIEQKKQEYIEQYKIANPGVEERYIIVPVGRLRLRFTDPALITYIETEIPKILKYEHSKSRYKLTRRVFFKAKKLVGYSRMQKPRKTSTRKKKKKPSTTKHSKNK